LDGLGDTFDGIFSNRSREKMLEIMRDSRIGTNAVLAVICVVILNYALLSSIPLSGLPKALLCFLWPEESVLWLVRAVQFMPGR